MLTIIYTKYSTWSIAEWELDIIIMHSVEYRGGRKKIEADLL